MFHVSSFSEGAKQSFSARSHPTMPRTATNENAAFSQQFPQWQLFFPCSPFREPIWGTEAIKPAENEKKNNSLRSQETKYSIQWTQSLTTQLFLISLMSLYQSLRNYVFSTAFSQHPSLFVWLYTKVLHDVSCVFRNNELIEKLSVCIYSSFCDQCVGVNGSSGPEANIQLAIQDNSCVNEGDISLLLPVFNDTRLHSQHSSGAAGGIAAPTERRRENCQRWSVKCLLMGHSSVPFCTVKTLWCTVKPRQLNKNRKANEMYIL